MDKRQKHFARLGFMRRLQTRKTIERIHGVFGFIVLALCFSCSPRVSDGKVQNIIAGRFNDVPSLARVSVVVTDGVVNLSGEVSFEAEKSRAEDLAKVEGIREVRNNISVITPPETVLVADEPVDEMEVSEPVLSLEDEARQEAERFLAEHTAECGEFYYFRSGGEIYQCKNPHEITVEGRENPEPQYSESDKLNNLQKTWVQWTGSFQVTLNLCRSKTIGKDYWNVHYSSKYGLNTPLEWSDKEQRKKKPIRKIDGRWEIENESNFAVGSKIEKVTCADAPK